MRILLAIIGLTLLVSAERPAAHHSFAVFFDEKQSVKVTGTVTLFQFTNPHAMIELSVKNKNQTETWRAETNAQTLLRRNGWTKESLKVGEQITIEGWPARDGSNYMRMRRVVRADGTVLGMPGAGRANLDK